MSISADELRAFADAAVAEQTDSPTSSARLARRFVDQHKAAVIQAARSGQYSIEIPYGDSHRRCVGFILQFFREDFPGVVASPRISCNTGAVHGLSILLTWR